MTRKDIIDFCNDQIFPQITGDEAFFVNCKEVIKMVHVWRRENNFPKTMIAKVDDGFLYINDKPMKRIAPKKPKKGFDEKSYYIEGLILAKNETE